MDNKPLNEQPLIRALAEAGRAYVRKERQEGGDPVPLRLHENLSAVDKEHFDEVARANGCSSGMPAGPSWWEEPEWRAVLVAIESELDPLE